MLHVVVLGVKQMAQKLSKLFTYILVGHVTSNGSPWILVRYLAGAYLSKLRDGSGQGKVERISESVLPLNSSSIF